MLNRVVQGALPSLRCLQTSSTPSLSPIFYQMPLGLSMQLLGICNFHSGERTLQAQKLAPRTQNESQTDEKEGGSQSRSQQREFLAPWDARNAARAAAPSSWGLQNPPPPIEGAPPPPEPWVPPRAGARNRRRDDSNDDYSPQQHSHHRSREKGPPGGRPYPGSGYEESTKLHRSEILKLEAELNGTIDVSGITVDARSRRESIRGSERDSDRSVKRGPRFARPPRESDSPPERPKTRLSGGGFPSEWGSEGGSARGSARGSEEGSGEGSDLLRALEGLTPRNPPAEGSRGGVPRGPHEEGSAEGVSGGYPREGSGEGSGGSRRPQRRGNPSPRLGSKGGSVPGSFGGPPSDKVANTWDDIVFKDIVRLRRAATTPEGSVLKKDQKLLQVGFKTLLKL